jgi:H+-translocating NAD(P) transhydrogenase subunit alpha
MAYGLRSPCYRPGLTGLWLLLVLFLTWAASSPRGVAAESPAPAAATSEDHQPQPAETASEQSKDMLLLVASIYILVLAGFVGFEVIGRVSPLLHTPLMSATNAISGISLVGSLIAAGNPKLGTLCNVLGFIAVTAATINVVGGFMITDRMLKMFKLKGRPQP